LTVEIFEIAAGSPPPLTGGHYWVCAEHRLLRGPFTTREAAEADWRRFGTRLLSVILGFTVRDAKALAEDDVDALIAAALKRERAAQRKKRGRNRRDQLA
jgi:hypothetical protein